MFQSVFFCKSDVTISAGKADLTLNHHSPFTQELISSPLPLALYSYHFIHIISTSYISTTAQDSWISVTVISWSIIWYMSSSGVASSRGIIIQRFLRILHVVFHSHSSMITLNTMEVSSLCSTLKNIIIAWRRKVWYR